MSVLNYMYGNNWVKKIRSRNILEFSKLIDFCPNQPTNDFFTFVVGLVTPPLIASLVHSIKGHSCHKTLLYLTFMASVVFYRLYLKSDKRWCHQTDDVSLFLWEGHPSTHATNAHRYLEKKVFWSFELGHITKSYSKLINEKEEERIHILGYSYSNKLSYSKKIVTLFLKNPN